MIGIFIIAVLFFVTGDVFNSLNHFEKESGAEFINNPNSATELVDSTNMPVISFLKKVHDFKEIYQGEKLEHKFKFTNTGKEPLIIEKAKGSCGCTVPEWPKDPIAPGETAVMKINYDEKRVGPYTKSITITSNAKTSPKTVKVKGKIIPVESNNTPILKPSGGAPVVK